jgi:hypothetical protein
MYDFVGRAVAARGDDVVVGIDLVAQVAYMSLTLLRITPSAAV